jgi:hypothetical protein
VTSCPNGEFFDVSSGKCENGNIDFPYETCQNPTCIANGNNYQFTDRSDDCSASYYRCDQRNFAVKQTCTLSRTGSYFNRVSRTCSVGDAPSSCSSVKADHICIGKSTGNYKDENAVQCATYYECTNQNGVKRNCPQNAKYFNIASGSCQATNPPGQSCEGAANPCAGKSDGYYTFDNCNGGRYCSNEVDIYSQKCTNNQKFDVRSGICTSTTPPGCGATQNLCDGKSDGFHTVDDKCQEYFF